MNLFDYITKDALVFLMSMLPVVELRGAIPFGVSIGLRPDISLLLSIVGSIIPAPIIILGFRPLLHFFERFSFVSKFMNSIVLRAMRKSDNIVRYGFFGLVIFVGIPLPGTGVWTGSIIAALLDMRLKIALPAIFIGNIIAGIIIYAISYSTLGLVNLI